jgi:hypothetical protein
MKYFYYDAATRRGIQSAAAMEGHAEDISAIWKSLSQQVGSFLGVYCSTGVAVQFIWDDSGSITIDIPSPTRRGSMNKQSSFEECERLISHICSGNDPEKIPGLEFVGW